MDAPADDLRRGPGALLEFDIGFEEEIADAILGRGVGDRTQEGKAAALAVDGVLTRRERDVAPAAATALPDREPDQPESVERSAGEVQFRVGELSRRVAFVVRKDETRILTWSDHAARLWNTATGTQIGPALTHDGSVRGAAFSKDEMRSRPISAPATSAGSASAMVAGSASDPPRTAGRPR